MLFFGGVNWKFNKRFCMLRFWLVTPWDSPLLNIPGLGSISSLQVYLNVSHVLDSLDAEMVIPSLKKLKPICSKQCWYSRFYHTHNHSSSTWMWLETCVSRKNTALVPRWSYSNYPPKGLPCPRDDRNCLGLGVFQWQISDSAGEICRWLALFVLEGRQIFTKFTNCGSDSDLLFKEHIHKLNAVVLVFPYQMLHWIGGVWCPFSPETLKCTNG